MATIKFTEEEIKSRIDEFISDAIKHRLHTPGSAKSYKSYINQNDLIKQIAEELTKAFADTPLPSSKEIIDGVVDKCKTHLQTPPNKTDKLSKQLSAVRKFLIYLLGIYDGSIAIGLFIDEYALAAAVAKTAIFPKAETVEKVKNGKLGAKTKGANTYASWDNMKSHRDNRGVNDNKKKTYRDGNGILHDNNTTANYAIKKAILKGWGYPISLTSIFKNYEVCHIWGKADDEKYYTSIMNLVLIPNALAALSDSNEYVKDVLKYHSFELFGQLPGLPKPTKPKDYDMLMWRREY